MVIALLLSRVPTRVTIETEPTLCVVAVQPVIGIPHLLCGANKATHRPWRDMEDTYDDGT
jgi:hypothetical protein